MTIAQEYGLVKKKSTVAQEYGLAKPTSISAQLGMGIEESIIGKGLGLMGIEDEIPKVEPQTIPQKVARGIGALGPDLPLYIFGGGIPGAIAKKTVSPIISSASAFALPGVTRETLKQVEEGEGISPTKIATEGAKEAALGATIGAISKIPIKGIKGQAVKFPLETGAFAEAQALEQGRITPTPEEAIVAGLFLGSLKGFKTALSYGAKKLNVPEKELQKDVEEIAKKENKTESEVLADIIRRPDIAQQRATIAREFGLVKPTEEAVKPPKGVAVEAQRPQVVQEAEEVVKPLPSAPAEQIAPPVPIPGIKSAGAGKGIVEIKESEPEALPIEAKAGGGAEMRKRLLPEMEAMLKNLSADNDRINAARTQLESLLDPEIAALISPADSRIRVLLSLIGDTHISQRIRSAARQIEAVLERTAEFKKVARWEGIKQELQGGTVEDKLLLNIIDRLIQSRTSPKSTKKLLELETPSAPPAPPLETTLKAAKPPVVPEAPLTETRGVEGVKPFETQRGIVPPKDILQEQIAKAQERAEAETAPKPPIPQTGIPAEALAEKYPEAAIKVKPAKEGYTGQAEYDKATYTVSGKTEAEVLEKLDKRLASAVPYEEPPPTRKREPEATAMTPEERENIAAPEERLSGGKPGEFKPEQADAQREMEVAFKKAQDALQHGDKPNHQKAMQEIKNLADKMDEEKYARLQEPKRVISDREVAARAAGMPVEKAEAIIAKGAQGETTTAAEVLKQRAEINTAELHNSLPKDRPITEADIPDLMAKTTKTIEGLLAAETGPSEAGRTLRKADLQRKLRESLETLKRRAEREPKRAAEFFGLWAKTDPTNPEAVERFLLSVTEPKFFDYIYEFWYSSILSGPPTHLANIISTGLWTGWQIPHRFIRAVAEYPIAAMQGRPRHYNFKQAFVEWNATKQGIKEGAAKSWNIFMNGALEDDMTKWGVEMGKSVEAFKRSPYKPLRWAGKFVGIPGRALRSEDTFFKAIAWHREINVLAYEKAWADANKLGLKGQAWNDKVGEMVEFYTRKPTPDMLEKAKTFAQYATFNDAPGGPTNAVLSLRNAVHGSRFLIPFVNTISNLLQRGLEITPGVGLLMEGRRTFGPEAADVAAKQMTGIAAVAALWLATKYIDGEMTGALPQDTAEREAFYRQGKLPWAFGFNDPITGKRTYISYRRIEPFNTLFASIASWGDAFRDKEETPTAEKVLSLVIRLGRNLLDGSYLSQFNQAIMAINMGDRGIESTEKIVQRLATSFIPFSSALRSGTKALEAAKEGEVVLKKPETIGEAVREIVPFVEKTALPKRDVTGKEIVIPGGPIRQFLPYKLSVKQEDVVEDELARLKIFPSMPSRRIGGEELPDKEYAKYVELQGGIWRPQLYQIMSRPGWKRMPEFTQRALIKQIINQAREIARIQVRPNYRLEALQRQILGSPVESIE